MLKRFLKDNRGATALEYGLVIALVVVAAIPAILGASENVNGLFATVVAWL